MDVSRDGAEFVLADRHRRLAGVRLVQELGISDGLDFTRERSAWRLHLSRPPVDRMEYLFEVTDHNGHRATITDPKNPLRAPGAFGDKSVVLFPEYEPPAWLDAPTVPATMTPLEIDAPELDAPVELALWSPDGLDEPAPLVLVHDGPEFAELGGCAQYLGAGIASGAFPPLRAAFLDPGDRNVWYSANPAYARTIVERVLPELPDATSRLGVALSLGALAMLHLHRSYPTVLDGMLLQSGSFFTRKLDPQESGFSGFAEVTAFVASVHTATDDVHPVPTTLTCGIPEENLANNHAMAATLDRLGYPTQFREVRDTHNYTAWRDALHPSLTELIANVVGAHAA